MNRSKIVHKKKVCKNCGRLDYYFAYGLCRDCAQRGYNAKQIAKERDVPRKAIAPMSEKMKENLSLYSHIRDKFLNTHKKCEINVEGCTKVATQVHHAKGRGKFLCDADFFVAACWSCHRWVEDHPAQAVEMGVSFSRLAK